MHNRIFHFALACVAAGTALSSCTSQNGTINREQVDNSMKNAGAVWHTAVDRTSQSMKDLGPKVDSAKKQAGPTLDKAEQSAKTAGSDLGKIGLRFGNAIDNTAKDIKQSLSQPAAKSTKHKPTK